MRVSNANVLDHDLLVAGDGGRIVGFLQRQPWREAPHHVFRLYVHPDAQRRGVGTALVAEFEARIGPGARWSLHLHPGNTDARAFYARCGLEEIGRGHPPFAVLMAKRVPPRGPVPP